MDTDMELNKKTTILREGIRVQYSLSTSLERLALVDQLASFSLPVGTLEEMERESVAAVRPLP